MCSIASLIITITVILSIAESVRLTGHMWKTAFVKASEFEAQETFQTSSEIFCSTLAIQKQWPKLFKYENGLCELSKQEKYPSTSNSKPEGFVKCKTIMGNYIIKPYEG